MKISVITIVYNDGAVIGNTIKSVVCQSYNSIEYIIIDGKSTDNTLSVIESYRRSIDCVVSEPDLGIYDAMNKGLRRASGDLIIFMNAGDFFYSEYVVEMAAGIIEQLPNIDVFYGGIEVRYPDASPTTFMPPPPEEALDFLITGALPHQATFARRRAFGRTGLFDLRFRSHADYHWYLKVMTDAGLAVRRMPFLVASFALGGLSSEIETGQRQVFLIQDETPLLQTQYWQRRRLEIYQNLSLAAHLESAALRDRLKEKASSI